VVVSPALSFIQFIQCVILLLIALGPRTLVVSSGGSQYITVRLVERSSRLIVVHSHGRRKFNNLFLSISYHCQSVY
jgi:hypothetical protein